jgi:hypothetical protein
VLGWYGLSEKRYSQDSVRDHEGACNLLLTFSDFSLVFVLLSHHTAIRFGWRGIGLL